MGYGYYVLADGREAGYMVEATCDKDGCGEVIDRGLAYLCGPEPGGGEDCCGDYFCGEHMVFTPRGFRCESCAELPINAWAEEA